MLTYITERVLVGETQSLKERNLGVDVFDRAPDYDTNQDPVVRATAAEIRKRLAQYYQQAAHESEPRIELVSGSYVVEFHFNGAGGIESKQRAKRRLAIAVCAGGLGLVVLVAVLLWPRWTRLDIDGLWAPVLNAPGTALISVGQPINYTLRSIQAQDSLQGIGAPQPPGKTGPEDAIPKKDLLILPDRYVVLGDAICLARIISLFDRYGKPYRIRGERTTSSQDLSEGPTVLIGAFNNQWTLHVAGQLRFNFVKDSAQAIDMVQDREHPENTSWSLTRVWPYWDVTNDYAIVTRILDTTTNRPVVIAAGITMHGTLGAGEFLTTPEYFSEAVPSLPNGWQKKNLQIVLRVPVVNRVPGHPRVLATCVW